jgi:hypothetical protein
LSFEKAKKHIDDFVEKAKPEDISTPRFLIQKSAKEEMIKGLDKVNR